jgi:hypothetical protein
MIMDERLEFCDATTAFGAAGTALLGDVVDLEVVRDIGNGQPVYWVTTTDVEIITAASAGTLRFQLVSDAQAAIAVDGSATVHADTGSMVTGTAAANAAQFNAGGIIGCIALPLEGPVYERYLGVLAVTGTTATTAGKINSFLTLDPSKWKAYADAVN